MTIKEYLREYLSKAGTVPGSSIEIWNVTVHGKGKVIVEHSVETDSADIIHEKHSGGSDFYDARNGKELKDIVEFCLGPVVSESQWNQVKEPEVFTGGFEDDEDFN
jgi:hypothetical protein